MLFRSYIKYIKVDGKTVALNPGENGILTGTAIVFDESRAATLEVVSTSSSANIAVERTSYMVYDYSTMPPEIMLDHEGNPVIQDNDLVRSLTGSLTTRVSSLNDDDNNNILMIDVTVNGETNTYMVIIHLVNVSLELNDLRAYDGNAVDESKRLTLDRTYTPLVHDYTIQRIDYTENLGTVTVWAKATESVVKIGRAHV